MNKSIISIYKEFWLISKKNYKNAKISVFYLILIIICSSALASFIPYLMKEIVTYSSTLDIRNNSKITFLYLLAIAYSISWIIEQIMEWVKNILSAHIMIGFESSLIQSSLDNFFRLTYNEQKKISVGIFNSDVQRGTDAFGQINHTIFLTIFPIIAQLIFMSIFLIINVNIVFSIIFCISAIIIFYLTYKINKKSTNYFSEMYDARNHLNKFFIEKTSIPYEIKTNNSNTYELKKFDSLIIKYKNKTFESNFKIGLLTIFQVLLIGIFLIFFMILSTYLFQVEKITSGIFVLISTYILQLTMPFIMVSQTLMQLNGSIVALDKLYKYFMLEKDEISTYLPNQNDDSTLSNILFHFENVALILGDSYLSQFNYKILNKKAYAIVGKTGSGKTSFINYLLGITKISSGKLLYKNIDISKIYYNNIYEKIAFVSQDPKIISGSLRDNLIYNTAKAIDDTQIFYLLEVFNLKYILKEKSLSLDDNIDLISKNFSGGELQRISIIRALLKEPTTLILDEPTSALDQFTANKIINFLRSRIDSLIIITHSESCISLCDEIIDIDSLKSSAA